MPPPFEQRPYAPNFSGGIAKGIQWILDDEGKIIGYRHNNLQQQGQTIEARLWESGYRCSSHPVSASILPAAEEDADEATARSMYPSMRT